MDSRIENFFLDNFERHLGAVHKDFRANNTHVDRFSVDYVWVNNNEYLVNADHGWGDYDYATSSYTIGRPFRNEMKKIKIPVRKVVIGTNLFMRMTADEFTRYKLAGMKDWVNEKS